MNITYCKVLEKPDVVYITDFLSNILQINVMDSFTKTNLEKYTQWVAYTLRHELMLGIIRRNGNFQNLVTFLILYVLRRK